MTDNNNTLNNEVNNHNSPNEHPNDSRNSNSLLSKLNSNNGSCNDNDNAENDLGSSVTKSSSSRNIALSTLLGTLAKLIETSNNVVVDKPNSAAIIPSNNLVIDKTNNVFIEKSNDVIIKQSNIVDESNVTNVEKINEKSSKDKLDDRSSCQLGGSETSHLALNNPQSNISTGSIICRICHNNENIERLISPCLCKGSLAYVHRYCVEYWLSRSGTLHCELCMHPFNTRNTLRYSLFESLRIWYRHPNNRGLLQSDVLTCALLTIVSLGLIAMSFLSLRYFMMQGARIGLSRFWTQSSIIMFLCIVLFAYSINLFFIVRGQIIPWFRWWRSARQVHLILEPV